MSTHVEMKNAKVEPYTFKAIAAGCTTALAGIATALIRIAMALEKLAETQSRQA